MKYKLSVHSWRQVASRNIGTSLMLGIFVLLIGTYGAYQLQQLFSPDSGSSGDTANTRIQLRISDRKVGAVATLQNTLRVPPPPPANDAPNYNYDSTNSADGPTPLAKSGGNFTLFRIQGEVFYKAKP